MITGIFKKLFREDSASDLRHQLSSLVTEMESYQAEFERFHVDIAVSASHFEHILESNNFISAEWVNGNLHIKHHY
ncbi:TPA: hypothetical protein NGT43_002560 [Vibrio parahaemolyticus]|uniref:hypothetical protein n=1 Tax=Vibrio harveyi group TaxID=717610 RepID=UPI0005F23CE6|nr:MULTISPECIES: hypothetical protein [Vibrio harveyi group]EGR0569903.1 hypothetical protein [Vibrio cholerae]HAT8529930.1 hypothetical protein [Vibrio vulnificus]EGQ8098824.1 hypothetical protein [Vibrio parahaemolyticus]EGQ9192553.1 hypothetical protein [Vibrio parahaemolyticus]EGQ9287509.1 hypothetical protein [Vibrio parahaemolyticus]|tara:strand:+ start:8681 stop:8908 length:228 start_codon:yes stop_codon:yes gene_type:complete